MPDRAKRGCSKLGCPNTHRNIDGYCDEHASLSRAVRVHDLDQRKYYSSARWQKLRASVLREDPWCHACRDRGILKEATTVDHDDGNYRNEQRSNLKSLCRECHDSKSGRQHREKVPPRSFSRAPELRPAPKSTRKNAKSGMKRF